MKRSYEKAIRRAKNNLPLRSAQNSSRKGGRVPRWRIFIWTVEALIFIAVLGHFVIRPLLHYQAPYERTYDTGRPPAFTKKQKRPATDAESLKALTKQSPMRLPNLKFAAEGSATARQTQQSYARDTGLPVEVVNTQGMHFRLIPPGTYLMGSTPKEKGHNKTEKQHVVKIPYPFYMGMHEVTQHQWRTVMDTRPSRFNGAERPVEEITWYDCIRFLENLSQKEDVAWGTYRLPTEQEWEYSCRAGTTTAFVCGDKAENLHLYAAYKDAATRGTEAVGNRLPNAWGLFNMHGNVWEWCLTKYYGYKGNKVSAKWRNARAVRGGHWQATAENCRSANRARLGPTSHGNILGFRIVRDIPAELLEKTTEKKERKTRVPLPPRPSELPEKDVQEETEQQDINLKGQSDAD